MKTSSPELIAHIKQLYHQYRHTSDLEQKGLFFSPNCLQVCRPTPTYAATSRNKIVEYLRDAQRGNVAASTDMARNTETGQEHGEIVKGRGVYTIRPLRTAEIEFGSNDLTKPIGMTAEELESMAELEGWVGMRVDLWDEGVEGGLLVKVQYWWRLEDISPDERITGKAQEWRQCLHDIMYLGPKDGTEGELGAEILE